MVLTMIFHIASNGNFLEGYDYIRALDAAGDTPTLTTPYSINSPELYGPQSYWYEDYGNSSSSVTSEDFFIDFKEPFAAGNLIHARLSDGWFTLRFINSTTVEIA